MLRKILGGVFGAVLVCAVLVFAVVVAAPAGASYLDQGLVVSDDPVGFTPHVLDGHVNAVTTVGDRVIVAGTFSQVKNAGNPTVFTRNYIFAFDRVTGVLDTGFAPDVNGVVETLAAAPDGSSVFVGGVFSTVNGVSNFGLTKLDTATGAMVPGFGATTAGKVRDMEVNGSTLYIGGDIWSVNGVPRTRMAAVDVVSGALDPTFTVATTAPRVSVDWVSEIAVSPDGSEMMILGNFLEVDGLPRAQVAIIDLTGPTAQVADWSTEQFVPACSSSFWTYMRDVEYSPDGGYIAVVTTGGPRPPTLCDTASRWETGVTGSDQLETWADWSGGDTLTAVAVSDVAVYVGGHQRWMNNHLGRDRAEPGAVSREGLVALDPLNGVPFAWNPGRDRGVAVWDLHLSDLGLYVGSDTDFAGGEYHAKLAQFPLAGGTEVPVPTPAVLPTDLFAGSASVLTTETFDGITAGTPTAVAGNVMDWDQVTGAFHQAGRLYWTDAAGSLQSRSFDGVTMGASVVEPSWTSWPSVTSTAWRDGRFYYTENGESSLRYRYFSLESGLVGSQTFTVNDGLDWSATTGMVTAGDTLFYTTTSGDMYSIALSAGVPVSGTETLVSGPAAGDGRDWSGTDIFLLEVDLPSTVTLTAPLEGEAVAGDVTITADVVDDVGVASAEFFVDGLTVGLDTDGSDGWSVVWDSTAVSDGDVTIAVTATDTANQTATDSIGVTVDNLGPTVMLTAPIAGSTLSGTVSVAADATDEVGVAQTEFFAGGVLIGVDIDGTDGWSVGWDTNTAPDGDIVVSAVATDTFGRTDSDGVTVTVDNAASGVVAMVVANPATLESGDIEIKARLENLGYAVSVLDDSVVTPASVDGTALVIVSSRANSFVLGTKLVSVPQPVWVAKPWSLDDMGMTGTTAGTDFGTTSSSVVTIDNTGHPLASGYTGDVTVTTVNRTMSYGVPGAAAEIISSAVGRPSTFVYAQGAVLADASQAAGCRIHHSIFTTAPTVFTSDGWALFDTVVGYATNGCTAPPVDNPPVVAVTAPLEGVTVMGLVTVTADATDDFGVTQVEFFADGVSIGVDSDGADGWSQDWDTTLTSDGAVTVSATATDTAAQTGTGSVGVTVDNEGPQVSIISPTQGETVHDTVSVVADAGNDPTVTQVEFFIAGLSIGVDSDGADGWSQDWDTTTSADGVVAVSATATDASLRTASDSIDVTVDNAAAGFITMVVSNPASLTSGDTVLHDRFVANGYTVTLVDDSAATAGDAAGASFVYISSSVNAGVIGTEFALATQPVWTSKPWLLDNMGMTGPVGNTDYGTVKANTVTIVEPTHPLAAGYTGDVVVTPSNRSMSWGVPGAAANVVATANGLATSFVYQGGALLADGTTAAGCRLHHTAFQTAVLSWNADAWTLFDGAAVYAAGDCQ